MKRGECGCRHSSSDPTAGLAIGAGEDHTPFALVYARAAGGDGSKCLCQGEGRVPLSRTLRHARCACATLVVLAASAALGAQPATKPFRVGWLSASSDASRGVTEFQQGLRDLRYVEGQTVVIEYRQSTGSVSQLAELAAELARIPVDVIVTSGESPAVAAKRSSKSIPIVAIDLAWDPVKAGLVASLSKPEGNLTGLA
jgi:ABC-type uncharacterized transport system substrate-binding protein